MHNTTLIHHFSTARNPRRRQILKNSCNVRGTLRSGGERHAVFATRELATYASNGQLTPPRHRTTREW